MSSKAASAMSEESNKKSALVPRLRFPGFLEDWASSPMSELYSFKGNNSLSRDKLNYEAGELRNIHYGDIHTKFALHFRVDAERVPYINAGESSSAIRPENYCMAGDMVFADASEDMADIGKAIEIIDAGDVPLVSGLHTILARPGEGSFALGFGAYLFSSEGVRKQIQRESQGAKVLGLSATRLGNVQLHYPGKPDEQQKITDCLSSLDELIAAETQKLDALKTHKKGLMQQLFPREGETVPRLRFPEFREAGEWEEFSLSTQVELISGLHLAPDEYADTGEVPYFTGPSDFSNQLTSVSKWTVRSANAGRAGDTLITVKGNGVGELLYLMLDEVAIGRQLMAVKPSKAYGRFVFHFLATQRQLLIALASGNLIPGLSRGDILGLKVLVPKHDEQRMIADCLSSLDDLIAAQSQKIDVLKTHKKGLMQQLFPVLDEATA